MRELKFRAWDKKQKKYIAPNRLALDDDGALDFYVYNGGGYALECFIVEQYTGLKDKNGVEIYEGDIVKVSKRVGGEVITHITEVSWSDRYAQFWTDYLDDISDEITEDFFEVIGNIHENKELLENENN